MGIVLDASITLAWCFKDEATAETNKILTSLKNEPAHVPQLWSLEVGNLLISAERKKRISYADIAQFIGLLDKLNINVDNETHHKAFQDILSLAHSEKLTTYDAAYLELAMRRGFPLASKDNKLCEVALKLGVDLVTISRS
jgi:predicted nucleic acid-binding protein